MGGLFSKKKDSKNKVDSQELKSVASTTEPPKPDFSAQTPAAQPQNNFNNPFDTQTQQTPGVEVPTPAQMGSQPEDLFSNQPQENLNIDPNMLNQPQSNMPIEREEIQEMVDEVVEKIIEEKWEKVVKNVEKVVSWKETMEDDLNLMKEDIGGIKTAFEKLEKKLVGKLTDYDRDILDVSSEIKALEKVFQKITPTLVNNINELSRITSDLKGEKPKSETKK